MDWVLFSLMFILFIYIIMFVMHNVTIIIINDYLLTMYLLTYIRLKNRTVT